MPTYKVTLPDGRKARVMANSIEEADAAVSEMMGQSQTDSAQAPAQPAKQSTGVKFGREGMPLLDRALVAAEPYLGVKSPLGRALAGAAELPMNAYQSVAALTDLLPGVSGVEKQFAQARARGPKAEGVEGFLGSMASPLPMAAAAPAIRAGVDPALRALPALTRYARNLGNVAGVSAGQGASIGALTPGSAEDRALNTVIGGVSGAVLGPLVAGGADLARKAYRGIRGTPEEVGKYVLDLFGGDIGAVERAAAYQANTRGYRPTLAEASLNQQVAQAQKASSGDLTGRGIANKEALARELQAGTTSPEQLARMREARAQESGLYYDAAQAQGITSREGRFNAPGSIVGQVSDRPLFNQIEQEAMRRVQNLGVQVPGRGFESVTGLQQMKQVIDDDLERLGRGQPGVLTGGDRKILGDMRRAIVQRLEEASPVQRQADRAYREASRPIDAADVYNSIVGKAINEQGETATVRGAPLASAMRDEMSRLRANMAVQQATGNRRTTLADLLNPDQMQRLQNVRADLRREAQANKLGAVAGSDTARNLREAGRMPGASIMGGTIGKLIGGIENVAGRADNLAEIRARAFADPEFAQQLVRSARTEGERMFIRDLLTAPAVSGVMNIKENQ